MPFSIKLTLRSTLFTLLFLALALPLVSAVAQTAVTLLYFDTIGVTNGVFLQWETGTEFSTGGFLVRRAPADNPNNPPPDNEFVLMTQFGSTGNGFIPARGQGGTGALYEETDTTAIIGQAYWYRLIEVETNNTETNLEDSYVVAGVPATATPQTLVTNTPQPTTPTPTPTATTEPTNTAVPPTVPPGTTATPTTPPTATSSPTAVPTSAPTEAVTAPPTATNAPSGPTATPFVFPTAVDDGDSGGSGAIAEAAGQQDDPYPAPDEASDSPPAGNEAYPGAAVESDPDQESLDLSYPAGQNSNALSPANPVGSENGDDALPPPVDAPAQDSADGNRNTLLLWVGFAGAMLLFGGGIYGATILYNRQRQAPPEI